MSKILVMIPSFNSDKSITLSIESCISQTLHTNVVIVDNCSSDNTREVVLKFAEKYPNIKLVVNEKNLGRIGNWNKCLDLFKESEYEYVQFLFTGDTLKPNCVEEVEKVFANHPKLGAVFWPYEFKQYERISISRHYKKSIYLPPNEINELNINDGGRLGAIVCNVYSKSAIIESRAHFNEIFIGKADFDYCVLQNHGAYHLNKVLSTFNAEHHGTFKSALDNYRVNIEASFNSACALERSRDTLSMKKYEKFKTNIILASFEKNIHFLKTEDLYVVSKIVIKDIYIRFKSHLRLRLRNIKNSLKI